MKRRGVLRTLAGMSVPVTGGCLSVLSGSSTDGPNCFDPPKTPHATQDPQLLVIIHNRHSQPHELTLRIERQSDGDSCTKQYSTSAYGEEHYIVESKLPLYRAGMYTLRGELETGASARTKRTVGMETRSELIHITEGGELEMRIQPYM